jgi:hypothetical protein
VVLELQQRDLEASLKERVTAAAAARSAQASQVFVWTENRTEDRVTTKGLDFYVSGTPEEVHPGPSFAVYLKNTSRQPVYDILSRTDHGDEDRLQILMPDGLVVFYKPPETASAVVDFRDAGFALWSREGSGVLVDRGDDRAVPRFPEPGNTAASYSENEELPARQRKGMRQKVLFCAPRTVSIE